MKRILIVDDQKNIRDLVKATLKIFDAEFITADNGEDAISLAGEFKPDIIIMDIVMPGKVDGLQALRKIHSTNETQDCKVVLLTSQNADRDKNFGYNSGASGYLVKPFRPIELINLTESLL